MPEYVPDPDLNRLVRQLNEEPASDRPAEVQSLPPATTHRHGELDLDEPLVPILRSLLAAEATDLLLVHGSPPIFRIDGQVSRADLPAVDAEEIRQMFVRHAPKGAERLETTGSLDFSLSLSVDGASDEAARKQRYRFRVNLHRQRGTLAAAVRMLPPGIPTLEQLSLPASLASLVETVRGLILVCGPTGAGKSSTLAALIGVLNRARPLHIITIEDPVEYEHRNEKSIIEHIEIGRDAPSFATALRAALRQDPDVILVGEMRDLETVSTAMTAAETGHLILSTLHTGDVGQAIHRMIDLFPPEQQTQIRHQLALSLNAILCQQLVPRLDRRGRVPAIELLVANHAIRNHIRQGRIEQLVSELTLGKRQGMVSLEESLSRLAREGVIDPEEAQLRSRRPDELRSLRGS